MEKNFYVGKECSFLGSLVDAKSDSFKQSPFQCSSIKNFFAVSAPQIETLCELIIISKIEWHFLITKYIHIFFKFGRLPRYHIEKEEKIFLKTPTSHTPTHFSCIFYATCKAQMIFLSTRRFSRIT